jgi:hypothetical protein
MKNNTPVGNRQESISVERKRIIGKIFSEKRCFPREDGMRIAVQTIAWTFGTYPGMGAFAGGWSEALHPRYFLLCNPVSWDYVFTYKGIKGETTWRGSIR